MTDPRPHLLAVLPDAAHGVRDPVAAVRDALARLPGWRVTLLDDHAALAAELARLAPTADLGLDLCAGGLFGDPALSLHVPALFELVGLPFVGAGARARAVCAPPAAAPRPDPGAGRGLLLGGELVAALTGAALPPEAADACRRALTDHAVHDVARLAWTVDGGRPGPVSVDAGPGWVHDPLVLAAALGLGLDLPGLLGRVVDHARARQAGAPRPARGVAAPTPQGPTYVPGPVLIRRAGAKGHGLFAARRLRAGEAFCEQPAVLLDEAQFDALDHVPALKDYEFDFDDARAAFAVGHVAFMNHDDARPNATVERDLAAGTLRIRATRDVAPGEELVFSYRCGPWWAPAPPQG